MKATHGRYLSPEAQMIAKRRPMFSQTFPGISAQWGGKLAPNREFIVVAITL